MSLQGSASTPLRNVRIAKLEPVNTPQATGDQALRFGPGAFCLWANEDYAVAHVGPEVVKVTVEAFDARGNVHKGLAIIDMTCVASGGGTSQEAFYQKSADGSAPDGSFCGHMNSECVAEANLPSTCGPDVCQCSDMTLVPDASTPGDTSDAGTTFETPATPGNVCIAAGDRVACGPVAPSAPGTPVGEVCITDHETAECGPVSVCVSGADGIVCGSATGPGTNPGEVCVSHEGTVCGPAIGSGSGTGNSGGDVCISHEGTVCGQVSPGGSAADGGSGGCVSNREGTTCADAGTTSAANSPGEICVAAHERTCGQVPVASSSSTGGSSSSGTGDSSSSTGAKPKTGCSAFPGADLSAGLLAVVGIGALRRRRRA